MNDYPELHPEELKLLSEYFGYQLTNEQAHMLLREKIIESAFNAWIANRASAVIQSEIDYLRGPVN